MDQNINAPSAGMIMSNPSLIKEGQFLLLVNGNIQSVDGNFAMIANDQSNLLGTRFKQGYKVIGTNVVPSLSVTFFFLHNPDTLDSEIGFIFDTTSPDKPDPVAPNGTIVETAPLETIIQYPLSPYYTFVNAQCLNFDIDHPVSSWIKIDDCNVRIYFNDFKNPPRYVDYKDFQKIDLSNCPLIETDQLDCFKILIFPETCYPVVDVIEVVPGGQNTAGVYQFAICYSDVRANKLTDYFYVTNPVPLGDQPIVPNTNTAYPVYKSLKLQVSNLNQHFKYFNLAVLKTINNVTSVYLVETFEVNSNFFEYIYTGVDKNIQADLSIDEIISKRPYYNKAKITTENNGYLFLANLEEDRILNLQPVVNNIPLQWQTVEMNEGSYADPIIAENYVGYLGDEVYAFGISFTKSNGKQTNIFPFIGRDALPNDLIDVSCFACTSDYNLDCASGLPTPTGICRNPDVITPSTCQTGIKPNLNWEVYNTAGVPQGAICVNFSTTLTPIDIQDDIECISEEILINSLYINPATGETTENNIPIFYKYPASNVPCGDHFVVYPPLNSDAARDLYSCYLTLPSNILSNLNTNTNIGLCNCDDYKPIFENAGATNVTVITEPLVIDPYAANTSVEIVREETVFRVNAYGGVGEVPKPSNSPDSPSPCRNWAVNDQKNESDGWEGWVSIKENWSSTTASSLTQSSDANCSYQTWGAFITADNSPSHSWYNFYCTNQDGVAAITLSTENTSLQIFVYNSDLNGSQIFPAITIYQSGFVPINPPAIYGEWFQTSNGWYVLLRGLTYGSLYYIDVYGQANHPTGLAGAISLSCKEISFKICVISPTPLAFPSSYYQIVPGIARVTRICKVSYKGLPENNCKPKVKQYGDFAYWKSEETYPCNEEVYGDVAGKPIRHFKFPDHSIIPFFEEVGAVVNNLSTKTNKIYPKGVKLDINQIKSALNSAVVAGLITEEEKEQICGYRVYRSNRRGNQSIIAKGLLYDVWDYKDNIYNTGNRILFPNFPFNDNTPQNSFNSFIKTKRIRTKKQINDSAYLQHPYYADEYHNNKYTFDSPNLSFNNPGLGTELKLECEQYGRSVGSFIELRNNSKYQYVGAAVISAAIGFASVEAAFEALNTMANATLTITVSVLGSGTNIPLGLILAAVGENILSPLRIYSHYSEWYDIIKKFAPYRNYAVYYNGVGKYTASENVDKGNTRRTIANAQYIKPGILNVKTTKGSVRFNNFKRDSSVFIELEKNAFFNKTKKVDNSRVIPGCDFNLSYTADICSYYGSLKNPLVNQYGQIDNIDWIDTGYNGKIDWSDPSQNTDCDTIFGGDTFISRFTKKRKVPMFLEDRVVPSGSTDVGFVNQDIQLSLLPNIGYPRYFMDYPTSLDYTGTANALFGDVAIQSTSKVDFNFLCKGSDGQSWKNAGLNAAIVGGVAGAVFGVISLPIVIGVAVSRVKKDLGDDLFLTGKYVHSFYGITTFLCESDYNLDLRHGENIKERNFYPNVGDINEWTQEFFVPMYEDNYYLYNTDYSKQNTFNPNFVLNNDFKQSKEDCKAQHPNRLIYSLQDNDQNDKFDGNLIFLANNYYEFPKSGGKLLIVKGIENGKVLAIQENRSSVFNSYIALQTNVAVGTVGANTLFNQSAPTQFLQTDLGFGGSQTPAIVSTEFGHFWVDNKRGQILEFSQGINNIVKAEEEWWFKENLPFHILEDFPDFDITNNFKYIGMAIVYDARYKRVIFTKRDVELKPQFKGLVTYDGTLFNLDNLYNIVLSNNVTGTTFRTPSLSPIAGSGYILQNNGLSIEASFQQFNSNPPLLPGTIITTDTGATAKVISISEKNDFKFTIENDNFFCNKSWTISYSPLLKNFISFHTFTPNYYTPNQSYFSSGINYSFTAYKEEYGLWHHNITNKSYQVYYGKLEPFIFEFGLGTKYNNSMLDSVRYTAEFYRFQDNLSSGLIPNKTYNKALIYNQKQSTGSLELVASEKNNRRQYILYPKQNSDSRSILVSYVERAWQFNDFYDVSKENSGQPLLSFQCDNIAYKELNSASITYKSQYLKKKMISDYHVLRLENDIYSNYNIIHRHSVTKTNNINN